MEDRLSKLLNSIEREKRWQRWLLPIAIIISAIVTTTLGWFLGFSFVQMLRW